MDEPTTEPREATEPGSADTDTDTDGKTGPGRPKGAKNKTTPVDVPRTPRKQPEDIKNPLKAMKSLTADYNKLVKRHNAEHPNSQYAKHPGPVGKGKKPAAPVDVTGALEGYLTIGALALRQKLKVEAVADPKAVHETAVAWNNLAEFITIDIPPVWIAAGTAVGCTLLMVLPMVLEAIFGSQPASEGDGKKPPAEPLPTEKAADVKVDKKGSGK